MGYYTHFELTWEPQPDYQPKPICEHKPKTKFCGECGKPKGSISLDDAITEFLTENKEIYYGIESDGSTSDSAKWYDYNENMIAMSEQFPNVLFKLHGEGEDSGDIWDTYYLNGQFQQQKARVMIDACDPKQWKKGKKGKT